MGLPSNDKFQFPPTPIEQEPRPKPVRAGTSALSRALNMATTMASKKLWGTTPQHSPTLMSSPASGYPPIQTSESPSPQSQLQPQSQTRSNGVHSSPRSPAQVLTPQPPDDIPPEEEKLLGGLETLAQKVEVIMKWADELYDLVKGLPEKPIPDPEQFVIREGESPRQATKRRNAQLDAELSAINCISLYMLVMNFAQNGVNRLQDYINMIDVNGEPPSVSPGFDDAVDWYGARYAKCSERAQVVKGWLPESGSLEPPAFMDQVLFERALTLSRNAARKEILDQSSWECEEMYHDALWLLYTVRDDLEARANEYLDEDRSTIDIWITRTKLRYHRCQARAMMPEGARRKDAQADQNLDDVNRFPPPWELQPLPENSPLRN